MSLDDVFLSSRLQPASTWLSLLGGLSSLAHLVPGESPPHANPPTHSISLVGSPGEFLSGLLVEWLPQGSLLVDEPRTSSSGGVSILTLTRPRLLVRRRQRCSPRSRSRVRPLVSRRDFSFLKVRELLAVERCLHLFHSSVSHSTVAMFADNSAAVAYLRNAGGTQSPPLNTIAQRFLRWSELQHVRLAPSSSWEVTMFWLPLSLSRTSPRVGVNSSHGSLSAAPPPVSGNDRPVCYLSKSPLLHLFLALPRSSGDGDGCSSTVLGPPLGLSVPFLDFDSTCPPQALIVFRNCVASDRSVLATKALVSGSAGPSNRPAGNFASSTRSPQPASLSASSSQAPQASSSCLATLQRFARAVGFSSRLAAQVGLARCSSCRTIYQLKWSVYRQWCRSVGHSVSRHSLPKVTDFLL